MDITTWVRQQPNETREQWAERLTRHSAHDTLLMLSYGALPGTPGELTKAEIQKAWKRAKAVGISRQEFDQTSPAELDRKILDRTVRLERARIRPDETAMVKAVMDEVLGTNGRPIEVCAIDGSKVTALRDGNSRKDFAKWVRIDEATLQKAEKDNLASENTLKKFCVHARKIGMKLKPLYFKQI